MSSANIMEATNTQLPSHPQQRFTDSTLILFIYTSSIRPGSTSLPAGIKAAPAQELLLALAASTAEISGRTRCLALSC